MRAALRVPKALAPGDRVRLVAPSGPFERPVFDAGVALLEKVGLVPVFDDGLFSRQRYLAGSDERRAAELAAAVADPEARAVWIARGGYGVTRIRDRLATEAVRAAGKWLVGFSDASALHGLWQQAGLVSLHGPNVTTLEGWGPEARRATWDWLFRGTGPTLRGRTVTGSGTVRGPLVGGNLTVLAALAGGGQLPSWEGALLLLEDVGERPYRLDRCLTALASAGALRGIAGAAIGQLTGCEEPPEKNAGYTALEVLHDTLTQAVPGLPILAGLPIGHEPTSFPVPLGHEAVLDLEQGTLAVAPLR